MLSLLKLLIALNTFSYRRLFATNCSLVGRRSPPTVWYGLPSVVSTPKWEVQGACASRGCKWNKPRSRKKSPEVTLKKYKENIGCFFFLGRCFWSVKLCWSIGFALARCPLTRQSATYQDTLLSPPLLPAKTLFPFSSYVARSIWKCDTSQWWWLLKKWFYEHPASPWVIWNILLSADTIVFVYKGPHLGAWVTRLIVRGQWVRKYQTEVVLKREKETCNIKWDFHKVLGLFQSPYVGDPCNTWSDGPIPDIPK